MGWVEYGSLYSYWLKWIKIGYMGEFRSDNFLLDSNPIRLTRLTNLLLTSWMTLPDWNQNREKKIHNIHRVNKKYYVNRSLTRFLTVWESHDIPRVSIAVLSLNILPLFLFPCYLVKVITSKNSCFACIRDRLQSRGSVKISTSTLVTRFLTT